jgi:hypothetical protein
VSAGDDGTARRSTSRARSIACAAVIVPLRSRDRILIAVRFNVTYSDDIVVATVDVVGVADGDAAAAAITAESHARRPPVLVLPLLLLLLLVLLITLMVSDCCRAVLIVVTGGW